MNDPRTELAKKMFPEDWARAECIRDGYARRKKRQQLRRRAENEVKLADLRKIGASCSTCTCSGKPKPMHKSHDPRLTLRCDLHSKFAVTQLVAPEYLCIDWSDPR